MTLRHLVRLGTAVPLLLACSLASAQTAPLHAPLTLTELGQFNAWLACTGHCTPLAPDETDYTAHALYHQCVAECGAEPPRLWEKNGVPPTDLVDYELALLEYLQAQGLSVAAATAAGADTSTALTKKIVPADGTIPVTSTDGFPASSSGPGYLAIDLEYIEYAGRTATAFTGVTRGALGTVAAQHASGAAVTFRPAPLTQVAADVDDAATTLTVNSTTGFPDTSDGAGFLVVGTERIEYAGRTASTFTGLTRGVLGTPAATHSVGTEVTLAQDVSAPTQSPGGPTLICYSDPGAWVVPAPLCTGAGCEAAPVCTVEECALPAASSAGNFVPATLADKSEVVWYANARPAYCTAAWCEAAGQLPAPSCVDPDENGLPAWLDDALPGQASCQEDPKTGTCVVPVDPRQCDPPPACCAEEPPPAGCAFCGDRPECCPADSDLDGTLSPAEVQAGTCLMLCDTSRPCQDLTTRCLYDPAVGQGTCQPRCPAPLGGDGKTAAECTAFHLRVVAEDDTEAIVHVWYDYTPVAARALDLHLAYSRERLTLLDARALAPLHYRGKKLASTHLADGTLRLTVYDDDASHPIPPGPIIELVFQRHVNKVCPAGKVLIGCQCFDEGASGPQGGTAPVDIRPKIHWVIDQPQLLNEAIAPDPGDAVRTALEDPALWGPVIDPVTGKALHGVALTQASKLKTRLRLLYGFEKGAPETYRNVPTACELCAMTADCAGICSGDPSTSCVSDACEAAPGQCVQLDENTKKEKRVGQLETLQAGRLFGGQPIQGPAGAAIWLDGNGDHLRLPVHVDRPLFADDQTFSWAGWFYTEGNTADELKDSPQVLFAHVNFSERTRFGLELGLSEKGSGLRELTFFTGSLLEDAKVPACADIECLKGTKDCTTTAGCAAGEVCQPGTSPECSCQAVCVPRCQVDADCGPGARCVVADGTCVGTHVLSRDIQLRTWHHVAFTLDPKARRATLYFDGQRVSQHDVTLPGLLVSCPQFQSGVDIALHREGENVLGGRPPESIYTAVRASGRYHIERIDDAGARTTLIGGDLSARDPDYSPVTDRLLFASNSTGSWEIWMAKGDGTGQTQVTLGFGDADRGFAARRPRWAPDGSGFVFESDAFDVLAKVNTARVAHLYHVAYDATGKSETPFQPLDFDALVAAQKDGDHRITSGARHHRRAWWLAGKTPASEDGTIAATLGTLVLETANPDEHQRAIERLTIAPVPSISTSTVIGGLAQQLGGELDLLAAGVFKDNGTFGAQPVERALYRESFEVLGALPTYTDPATQVEQAHFTATTAKNPAGGWTVTVTHTPQDPLYDLHCWDLDENGVQTDDEDLEKDGIADARDCYPTEIVDLYLEYPAGYVPVLEGDAAPVVTPELEAKGKSLKVSLAEPASGGKYLRIELRSPQSVAPVPKGSKVATIGFLPSPPTTTPPAVALRERRSHEVLRTVDLGTLATTDFPGQGVFDRVDDAAFGPDAGRLALAAVSHARPTLLRTTDLAGGRDAAGNAAESLLETAATLGGLSWTRREAYYPCNWVGGVLHPQTKRVVRAFRGGLDDVRLYSGAWDPDAVRSTFERGLEFLQNDGLWSPEHGLVPVETKLPTSCDVHSDCPAFHLCDPLSHTCRMVPCNPEDPNACAATVTVTCQPGDPSPCECVTVDDKPVCSYQTKGGGHCTLRPIGVEQENIPPNDPTSYDWVCSASCATDTQCFSQACPNGPCRFCVAERCVECKEAVEPIADGGGELVPAGCPDARSFVCVAGVCETDCYAVSDEASTYLCDPALEYCSRGRCVLHEWDWWDFAGMSLAGGGQMRRKVDAAEAAKFGWRGYTQAVDQTVPIEVRAYGVADKGTSPQVLVEVSGGPFYPSGWHQVGQLRIDNRTTAHAKGYPYRVTAEYPFDQVRLRMVTSPMERYDGWDTVLGLANVGDGATGLGEQEKDFCVADLKAAALAADPQADVTALDTSICFRRGQGSRFDVGYPLTIPEHEGFEFCKARGYAGCTATQSGEFDFLKAGAPTVVVLGVDVAGKAGLKGGPGERNLVCPYVSDAGEPLKDPLAPLDAGRAKKILYGTAALRELSAEWTQRCELCPYVQAEWAACAATDPDFLTEACQPLQGAGPVDCPTPPAWCGLEPDQLGLVDFMTGGGFAKYGIALLNCNVNGPSGVDPASLVLGPFEASFKATEWPARSGVITSDTGDTCSIDTGKFDVPCLAGVGDDASLDWMAPYGVGGEGYYPFGAFEWTLARSFGHEEGFTTQDAFQRTLLVRLADASASPESVHGLTLSYLDGETGTLGADNYSLNIELWTLGYSPVVYGGPDVTASPPGASCAACSEWQPYIWDKWVGPLSYYATVACAAPVTPTLAATGIDPAIGGEPADEVTVRVTLTDPGPCPEGGTPRTTVSVITVTAASATQPLPTVTSGTDWKAEVVGQPADAVCTVTAASQTLSATAKTLTLRCDNTPKSPLTVAVSGLGTNPPAGCGDRCGQGLELAEVHSQQTLPITAAGETSFASSIFQGFPYLVKVTSQPRGYRCTVGLASGVMPAPTAPTVTCTPQTPVVVEGTLLAGIGAVVTVTLATGGQSTSKTLTAEGLSAGFSFPEMPLFPGDVAGITAVPDDPSLECTVAPATIAVQDGLVAPQPVTVGCIQTGLLPDAVFTVSGTVTGLKPGNTVRLTLVENLNPALKVTKENGEAATPVAFTFPNKVTDGFSYQVDVAFQPPGQLCTVTSGGQGAVSGKNVTDVVVECSNEAFTVTLDIAAPDDFALSVIHAALYRVGVDQGEVAREPDGVKTIKHDGPPDDSGKSDYKSAYIVDFVLDNQAKRLFTLVSPSQTDTVPWSLHIPAANPAADPDTILEFFIKTHTRDMKLPGGQYQVVVWLDKTGDKAKSTDDLGYTHAFTVPASDSSNDTILKITDTKLAGLVRPTVVVKFLDANGVPSGTTVSTSSKVACYFTAQQNPAQALTPPLGRIGTTSCPIGACGGAGLNKLATSVAQTDWVPPGEYYYACRVDYVSGTTSKLILSNPSPVTLAKDPVTGADPIVTLTLKEPTP